MATNDNPCKNFFHFPTVDHPDILSVVYIDCIQKLHTVLYLNALKKITTRNQSNTHHVVKNTG